MKYWSLRLVAVCLKIFSIVFGLFGIVGFIISLFAGQAIFQAFLQNGIYIADGLAGIVALNFCLLMIWLWTCLLNYALAHFIDLQIGIEQNQRRIIHKL